MTIAHATRRSGRMYLHSGPTVPTRTRSVAHDPAPRRTTPVRGHRGLPGGKGVRIARTGSPKDLFRQLFISPRLLTPIARARVRRGCSW